jgi:hypothetical protein
VPALVRPLKPLMLLLVAELQLLVVPVVRPLELQVLSLMGALGGIRVAIVPALVRGFQPVVVSVVGPFQAGVLLVVAGLQLVVYRGMIAVIVGKDSAGAKKKAARKQTYKERRSFHPYGSFLR